MSFTITPVADGVDELTFSVTVSKRATSIADFLASHVRLNVSLTPFSVIGALFISKALHLARLLTVTNSVCFLFSMACCVVCRLCILDSSFLSSSAILGHCRTFVSEASLYFSIAYYIKVCIQPVYSVLFFKVTLFGIIAQFSQEISDILTFLLNRAEEIETRSKKITSFLRNDL